MLPDATMHGETTNVVAFVRTLAIFGCYFSFTR